MGDSEKRPSGLLLFEGFLLCEEFRVENNGKLLFIGGFNDSITFPQFPAQLPFLCLALKIRVIEAGEYRFEVEIRDTDEQPLVKAQGGFNAFGENSIVWLPVTIPGLNLSRAGKYAALVTLDENPTIKLTFEAVKASPNPQFLQSTQPKPN